MLALSLGLGLTRQQVAGGTPVPTTEIRQRDTALIYDRAGATILLRT